MRYRYYFSVDSKGSLRMFVRYNGRKFTYSLSFFVDKSKWDASAQRCKRNTTHGKMYVPAASINTKIQRYENTVLAVANNFHHEPTFDQFKTALDKILDPSRIPPVEEEDFFSLYARYIDEQSQICGWGQSVIYKHTKILQEWKTFDPDMSIDKISPDTLDRYIAFQIILGHQNETIKKRLSMSKWFFRWLVAKGHLSDISFTAYKPHLKKANKNVVFLTWQELMTVYHHQFDQDHLTRTRDVFCFCCFTSLRYSDVYALKKTDIYDDAIHIVTQKTNDKITIELNKFSRAILAKYESLEGAKALPVVSNQKMNIYLKEVCRLCNINENLTDTYYVGGKKHEETKEKWEMMGTHCGRRTFICNALMLGIAPNVVMKWTGHSDYKSMQPYIDIADSAKKTAMSLFDNDHSR